MPTFRVPVTSSPSSATTSFRASTRKKLGVSVTVLTSLILGVVLTLSGCKESDADKIGDAQECLDKYSRDGGGDLAACEAYVAGLNTPAAHGIRCATGYIREGFSSAQSFIDAFSAIETVNATTVRDFLRVITFDSVTPVDSATVNANYAAAQRVNNSCSLSLAKGATIISSFSFLTNVLFKYSCDAVPAGFPFEGGTCNMDDDELAGAIAYGLFDQPGSAATVSMRTDLGSIVVNANTVSCSSGASNETLCEFLQSAIDNAGGPDNKAQVGEEFLEVLTSP